MKKHLTIILSLTLIVLLSSCNTNGDKSKIINDLDNKEVNEEQTLLQDDVEIGVMEEYPDIAEGKSKSIDRSFENAPPLIPHTVKGMMVITKNHNVCLNCHSKEKAKAEKATPIPNSHYTDYRPEVVEKDGFVYAYGKENEITAKSTNKKLNMAQYNCNQCHVPLTNATVVIRNTFEPVFRNSSDKNKSNLVENITEGVK